MTPPLFVVGERVDYTPHHPAFKKPDHPFQIVSVMRHDDGSACYWIRPLRDPVTRTLRNGRVVQETPNWEALVGEKQLQPWNEVTK